MKHAVLKLLHDPALLLAVATAVLGLLVLLDVPISEEVVAGIMIVLGSVVALLRFVVTPSEEAPAPEESDPSPVE